MPDFVNGLPLHALVVHFVVVLLPLAVFGAIVVALWPAARARYGWLVVAAAAVATVLVPIATTSGGDLSRRFPADDPSIKTHQELGDLMLYFAIPLLLAVTALMVVHEMNKRQQVSWAKVATVIAAVLTVGFAVAAGVHVYRVGDAGSRAVWEDMQNVSPRQ